MKIGFFDLETTGIPAKGANYREHFNEFPRVVSIAWKLRGSEAKYFIVRPEGYEIPEEATKIHGISTAQAIEWGRSFNEILKEFVRDFKGVDFIVNHNIYFDTSILKANALRAFGGEYLEAVIDPLLDKDKRIDTMRETVKFVGAKFQDGRPGKFPTLTELYEKLFANRFNAHNALDDVLATEKCFYKLVEIGVIPFGAVQLPLSIPSDDVMPEIVEGVGFDLPKEAIGELKNGTTEGLKEGATSGFKIRKIQTLK